MAVHSQIFGEGQRQRLEFDVAARQPGRKLVGRMFSLEREKTAEGDSACRSVCFLPEPSVEDFCQELEGGSEERDARIPLAIPGHARLEGVEARGSPACGVLIGGTCPLDANPLMVALEWAAAFRMEFAYLRR